MVGAPAHLPGHSDGAPVALLAALERPDLRRLVFSAGVFHHEGWAPGAIELDDETEDERYLIGGESTVVHYEVVDRVEP
jgi:pimeloyl-ACP methyl ester carboxylesterase